MYNIVSYQDHLHLSHFIQRRMKKKRSIDSSKQPYIVVAYFTYLSVLKKRLQ